MPIICGRGFHSYRDYRTTENYYVMAQSRLAGRALALAIGGAIGHDLTQRLARPAEGGHRDVRRQGKAQASPRSGEHRRGQWLQTSKELAAARAELHRLPAIDTQRDPDATLN